MEEASNIMAVNDVKADDRLGALITELTDLNMELLDTKKQFDYQNDALTNVKNSITDIAQFIQFCPQWEKDEYLTATLLKLTEVDTSRRMIANLERELNLLRLSSAATTVETNLVLQAAKKKKRENDDSIGKEQESDKTELIPEDSDQEDSAENFAQEDSPENVAKGDSAKGDSVKGDSAKDSAQATARYNCTLQ